MNAVTLMTALRGFTREAVKGIILPTSYQATPNDPKERPAEVWIGRLPDVNQAKKKAPYIIHQLVSSRDVQAAGSHKDASAIVRSVFCVYAKDGQEGSLLLMNLMERVRFAFQETVVIGGQFHLALDGDGLETMIYYDEDLPPYYVGEMSSEWKLPVIERRVDYGEHPERYPESPESVYRYRNTAGTGKSPGSESERVLLLHRPDDPRADSGLHGVYRRP